MCSVRRTTHVLFVKFQAAGQRESQAEQFGDSSAATPPTSQVKGRQSRGEEVLHVGFDREAAALADASGSKVAGALPEQLASDKFASPEGMLPPEHRAEVAVARGRREHGMEDSRLSPTQQVLSGLTGLRADIQGFVCSDRSQQSRSPGKEPHGQVTLLQILALTMEEQLELRDAKCSSTDLVESVSSQITGAVCRG